MGAAWFADKLKRREARSAAQILETAAKAGGFYRVDNGKPQYLGTDGAYHDVKRARRRAACSSDVKLGSKPILKNGSASLWDIGDGVACLEFHSKMNSLDQDSLGMVKQALDHVARR